MKWRIKKIGKFFKWSLDKRQVNETTSRPKASLMKWHVDKTASLLNIDFLWSDYSNKLVKRTFKEQEGDKRQVDEMTSRQNEKSMKWLDAILSSPLRYQSVGILLMRKIVFWVLWLFLWLTRKLPFAFKFSWIHVFSSKNIWPADIWSTNSI